jgi:Acetylornithine deacetylase/Succinyl-diaminopimelate desuccinylase and related deacylases
VTPKGKLLVGALADEEDAMIGVRHLVKSAAGRELDAAIICEPEENELCLEQRGVVWARIRARGKMAHGAMPEAGVNPITRSESSSAARPAWRSDCAGSARRAAT